MVVKVSQYLFDIGILRWIRGYREILNCKNMIQFWYFTCKDEGRLKNFVVNAVILVLCHLHSLNIIHKILKLIPSLFVKTRLQFLIQNTADFSVSM